VQFKAEDGVEPGHATLQASASRAGNSKARGRSKVLLRERFGPLCFAMALVADEERLRLVLRPMELLGCAVADVAMSAFGQL